MRPGATPNLHASGMLSKMGVSSRLCTSAPGTTTSIGIAAGKAAHRQLVDIIVRIVLVIRRSAYGGSDLTVLLSRGHYRIESVLTHRKTPTSRSGSGDVTLRRFPAGVDPCTSWPSPSQHSLIWVKRNDGKVVGGRIPRGEQLHTYEMSTQSLLICLAATPESNLWVSLQASFNDAQPDLKRTNQSRHLKGQGPAEECR
jgi:hypothetical protein